MPRRSSLPGGLSSSPEMRFRPVRRVTAPVGYPAIASLLLGLLASCRNSETPGARLDAARPDVGDASPSLMGCDGGAPDAPDCGQPAERCPSLGGAAATPAVLARRLSQFIWNQADPPDDLLADAAAIATGPDVKALAAKMMADPRARDGVAAFFKSWLRLDDLATLQKPGDVMTPDLIASMQKEAPAFGVSVAFDEDGRYETMMLAPYTFVDQTLAAHYGISGVTGAEMRKVAYPTPGRVGLLEGAGVLARYSGSLDRPWPPRRFWLTYETLLCDSTPIPPAITNAVRAQGLTVREDILTRTSPSPCSTCHVTVNPIGLAFSTFDTFGRYQPLDEAGAPAQTAGGVTAGLAVRADVTFSDASDLVRQLVARPDIRRCFSARVLDYALNPAPRSATALVDLLPQQLQCSLDQAHAAFESSGGNILELFEAVTATPAFMADAL